MRYDGYVIMSADGTVGVIPAESVTTNNLSLTQKVVGGYFAAIHCVTDGLGEYTMWVNDEGLLQGLPHNEIASHIARQYLTGDVMLSRIDQDGETTPFADAKLTADVIARELVASGAIVDKP